MTDGLLVSVKMVLKFYINIFNADVKYAFPRMEAKRHQKDDLNNPGARQYSIQNKATFNFGYLEKK